MKILVIGSGGREHALSWKLAQSPRVTEVYCAPGNAGTAADVTNVDIPADDLNALAEFAEAEAIDLTVVGPEQPLVDGVVDLFKERGLKVFGPSKEAAQLEGSKVYMKEALIASGVPTASYETFNTAEEAIAYLNSNEKFPIVVKADGLAAGKGVLVAPDREAAIGFVNELMNDKIFGTSGDQIIIEQFLAGEEASYIVVADGSDFVPLASSQDHKRVGDGDSGPNTGGMGAYSPAPVVTPDVDKKIRERVIQPLLDEMVRRGAPFTGFLYAGIMVDNGDPYTLEFNVRFGDPETQPILSRYSDDLTVLLEAAVDGRLSEVKPEWEENAAVCVVMAAGGYPGSYGKGFPISGLDDEIEGVKVFHAGTTFKDGEVVTSGGRVLGVTALAPTIKEATELAYKRVATINWDSVQYRKDIAKRALDRG